MSKVDELRDIFVAKWCSDLQRDASMDEDLHQLREATWNEAIEAAALVTDAAAVRGGNSASDAAYAIRALKKGTKP